MSERAKQVVDVLNQPQEAHTMHTHSTRQLWTMCVKCESEDAYNVNETRHIHGMRGG